mgnify:CR=1 FL=1
MDPREEFTRLMAWLVQNIDEVESSRIKADIGLLLGTASHLVTKLADRNTALAKQCRPRKSKPPKSAPKSGPKKQGGDKRSTDAPDTQNGAEDRSKAQSRIMQGVQQAEPSLADQQRALRGSDQTLIDLQRADTP